VGCRQVSYTQIALRPTATSNPCPEVCSLTRKHSINLDGTLVQPDQRRWQHSLGNALWHTDSSYHQRRSKYSLLLSHGHPVKGGSWTHFADTRRAYAELPPAKKDELEALVIEHDLWHSRKLASPETYANPTPKELALKPPAFHRLVQTAPDGRKTLYLAAHAKMVQGMGLEESQELIWELIEHCTQPQVSFPSSSSAERDGF
jgi:alpha-ketoglutarate-dependent 2,4-dichlorophenoxyacetate dioxygenase